MTVASPRAPLVEHTVLPQAPAGFKEPTSKGRGEQGRSGRGEGREGKGRGRRGKGEGHTGTSFPHFEL